MSVSRRLGLTPACHCACLRLVPGTVLTCNLEREDTRDVWISPVCDSPFDLPAGSIVGTASLRRQSQLLARNPGIKCVNFRGNVQTRLKKLGEGVVDGTLLANAGLRRMDMAHHITKILEFDEMLPAVAQGAIGIQCRERDERVLRYLDALNHKATNIAVNCERAFLAALDGNCRTPIAGQASIVGGQLIFRVRTTSAAFLRQPNRRAGGAHRIQTARSSAHARPTPTHRILPSATTALSREHPSPQPSPLRPSP